MAAKFENITWVKVIYTHDGQQRVGPWKEVDDDSADYIDERLAATALFPYITVLAIAKWKRKCRVPFSSHSS